jgi:hypothetical protein
MATVRPNIKTATNKSVSETWIFMICSYFPRTGLSADLPVGRGEEQFGSNDWRALFAKFVPRVSLLQDGCLFFLRLLTAHSDG